MILLLYAAIIIFGVGFDQLTKDLVTLSLPIDRSADVPVWEGVFHLRCISNDGAAFGMLDDKRWIFMTMSTVAILAMLAVLAVKHKKIPVSVGVSMALILSGGIGNMIDRIALGYVIDFIYFVPIDFPCFNVADSLVCIGAALMFVFVLFSKEEDKKTEDGTAVPGTETSAELVAETASESEAEPSVKTEGVTHDIMAQTDKTENEDGCGNE